LSAGLIRYLAVVRRSFILRRATLLKQGRVLGNVNRITPMVGVRRGDRPTADHRQPRRRTTDHPGDIVARI
jgi:hypothetical protein